MLLAREGKTLRWLAYQLDVDVSYLSKAVRGAGGKVPNLELVEAISRVLAVPVDYFAEAREFKVIDAVRANPRLRERIYRQLRK